MNLDTRETILTAARATAQAHGYGGLSFRELARQVGIKSASLHYHFPTKADLGVELARRYAEEARATLDSFWNEAPNAVLALCKYTGMFRRALENGNRMCMCGFMAAESDDLPPAVKAEVQAFADVNVAWLGKVLGNAAVPTPEQRALAIFAAVGGAQLAARSRGDVAIYDRIIESYRASGLIPD